MMACLEDLEPGSWVKGVLPDVLVQISDAKWHGPSVAELTSKDLVGRPGNELLYRDREPTREITSAGRPWSFDGDGALDDIESRDLRTGKLRFIEVKGRVATAETSAVTKNEIPYSLNKPDEFILAIVEFRDDGTHRVHYVRQPFGREPDCGVTSVNYDLSDLLRRATSPA